MGGNQRQRLLAILATLLTTSCVRNGYPSQMYTCALDGSDQQAPVNLGVRFETGQAVLSGDDRIYFGAIGVCPIDSRVEATRDQIYFDTDACGTPQYPSQNQWIGRFNRITKRLILVSVNRADHSVTSQWPLTCTKASWDPST